jgi:uncharacterized protein YcaQ
MAGSRRSGGPGRPRPRPAVPGPAVPALPLRAVAALFLERQHLDRPRGRRLTAASLARFAEDACGIQLDTINVVERAHLLTLWSRFGPYDRRSLERLLYRRRVLFEYWAHAACLVPVSHFGPWRRVMLDYAHRPRYRLWSEWARRNQPMLGAVEDAIRESGPLANADFEHRRPRGDRTGWWSRKPAAYALDYLWMTGRTAVHSRVHFQKRFDLIERVLPGPLREEPPTMEAFRRWHLRRSLHAMGAATESDLRMYLTFPGIERTGREQAFRALLEAGEVMEIAVEAADRPARPPARWFALAEDLAALGRAARRRTPSPGTTLLSPFDSLLWHRDRVRRLFGYDYTIEVYTPAPKRRHGYYSLPILHDGQLIGRLDPKTRREERRLEIKSVHFEPWFANGGRPPAAAWGVVPRDPALRGLAEALRSLARFVGADDLTLGRVSPAHLAAPLRRALG